MPTRKLRKIWVRLHRWIGLTAGLLFCIAGLSGSFLVYYPAIDRALNPELVTPQARGAPQPMRAILVAAQAEARGRFVHSVFPADASFGVHRVWLTPSAADQSCMWEVLVDPVSARVLGERSAVPAFEPGGRNLVNTVYTLHYNLFAGTLGATVVGIGGLLLLASLISGLVLWWPRGRKWRQALTLKRGARGPRRNVDLHRVGGSYGAVLLLVIAFSGVCLVFPDYVRAAFPHDASQGSAERARFLASAQANAPDADEVMAGAQRLVPGGKVRILWLPGADGPDWTVTLQEPSGIGLAGGRAEVAIDQRNGDITVLSTSESGDAASRFLAWQLPLHNGTVLGETGRALVCAAGFLPSLMMITGVLVWWRKAAGRRSKAL